MRKLTKTEFYKELDAGAGMFCLIGGTSSRNGREIILVGDSIYLFEPNEVGNEDWEVFKKELTRESEEYVKGMFSRSKYYEIV